MKIALRFYNLSAVFISVILISSLNINDIPKEELDNLYKNNDKNDDDKVLPNVENNSNDKIKAEELSDNSTKTNINNNALPKTGSPQDYLL